MQRNAVREIIDWSSNPSDARGHARQCLEHRGNRSVVTLAQQPRFRRSARAEARARNPQIPGAFSPGGRGPVRPVGRRRPRMQGRRRVRPGMQNDMPRVGRRRRRRIDAASSGEGRDRAEGCMRAGARGARAASGLVVSPEVEKSYGVFCPARLRLRCLLLSSACFEFVHDNGVIEMAKTFGSQSQRPHCVPFVGKIHN